MPEGVQTTGAAEAAPVEYPTPVQMEALGVLLRRWPKQNVILMPQPFDLPKGYLGVTFIVDKFVCGIAPDGAVSS